MRTTSNLKAVALVLACGATATTLIAVMGSWDASNPIPYNSSQGLFGRHGRTLHPILGAWKAITPMSWRASAWIFEPASPEERGEFVAGFTVVSWRFGRGLYDEVFVSSYFGTEEFVSEAQQQRGYLKGRPFVREFPAPAWVTGAEGRTAFGLPISESFGDLWWLRTIAYPHVKIEIALHADDIINVQEIEATRAFGWPLRSLVMHGSMRTVQWDESPEVPIDRVSAFSTDGLGDFDLGKRYGAREVPAVGVAWKPIWPMFLLNSVILGVPLVAIGWGVMQAVRSVWPTRVHTC